MLILVGIYTKSYFITIVHALHYMFVNSMQTKRKSLYRGLILY